MMTRTRTGVVVATTALMIGGAAVVWSQQKPQKGGGDETGPYELVENWPQPVCGAGYTWGS